MFGESLSVDLDSINSYTMGCSKKIQKGKSLVIIFANTTSTHKLKSVEVGKSKQPHSVNDKTDQLL